MNDKELANTDLEILKTHLKKHGEVIWNFANGIAIEDETTREIEKIVRNLDLKLQAGKKANEIYPSAEAPVILNSAENETGVFQWGFPLYQKTGVIFNARSETAFGKSTFRDSVENRRCILPAKKYYEWDKEKKCSRYFTKDTIIHAV